MSDVSVNQVTDILKDRDMLELVSIRIVFRNSDVLNGELVDRYQCLRTRLMTRYGLTESGMNRIVELERA